MKPKLLFLATEDWFIRSHFMPLVARAVRDGYDTIVAARMADARAEIEALGARTIDLPFGRGDNSPFTLVQMIFGVRDILMREQPAIVHAIALKPIMIALLAGLGLRGGHIYAVTGRGHLAISTTAPARLARWILRRAIGARVRGGAELVLENNQDLAWIESGGAVPPERVTILPGAGVDPEVFSAAPEPAAPVRIGVVTRLVQSKGVDLAVEAFKSVRATLPDAELWIAGDLDPENPGHVSPDDIADWRRTPGVRLLGHQRDIPAFWRDAHICCLASRGGEGLPRSLIEAAACARPIVTTDVPGCRNFVVDGVTGLIVPPGRADALAAALQRLAADALLRQRMAAAARARVLSGYTTTHVADLVSDVWRRMLTKRR